MCLISYLFIYLTQFQEVEIKKAKKTTDAELRQQRHEENLARKDRFLDLFQKLLEKP